MIWESHYWKNELLKITKRLKDRKKQKKWFDTSLAKIEQDVMLGFYIVRKLKEAKKLSDSVAHHRVNLKTYSAKGKNVTYMNWHKLDEVYDFSKINGQTRSLSFICDQIIHSYVFVVELDENSNFTGILFCSDKKRNKELYFLEIDILTSLFENIGNDYPSSATYIFNNKIQDYDVSNS